MLSEPVPGRRSRDALRHHLSLNVQRLVDARGLLCPLPLLRARAALASLQPGERLVVLATDPEAPIDLAALAADEGLAFEQERRAGEWRISLTVPGRS